ncbi:MAG: DUF192 domain-containing protein [Candidatus Nanoarchaeia archaeon]|nr:DUF192 domain-containing protein [Candidatus Omnitrophota bacterium]MDD5417465.1 DUF192 domain-containing protein [Candidatus Nanoarchaeia archaeon]
MHVDVYSKARLILSNAKWCNNFFENIMGYRFKRKGDFNGMVLTSNSETLLSLDMVFVFFPLHIYWVDKNFTVVEIKKIKPFQTAIIPSNKSQYVIESVKELPLKVGDNIQFRFVK